MKIPFADLNAQYKEIKSDVDKALKGVFKRGDFILGDEVKKFEHEFAEYCQRKFAVGVNSGTDALFLGLLSLGVGPGDEVIVPAFTYIATALAVTFTGARPVFADIDESTYNIDVTKIKGLITKKTKAIIPVHLYGQPAEMKQILELAKARDLKIVEDAAQAHGAEYKISEKKWQIAGSIGDIGCFSFYPTKNLGALGDGGMVTVDNEEVYKRLLKLRDYGRQSRYEHVTLGYNSRLDTVQAAILRIKLRHLDRWNSMRRANAMIYAEKLNDVSGITAPQEADYAKHIYHVYAVRLKNRDKIVDELNKKGINALIHYPKPLHLQQVYIGLGYKEGDFPVSEKAAREVMSLPMYPHLKEKQITFIVDTLKKVIK